MPTIDLDKISRLNDEALKGLNESRDALTSKINEEIDVEVLQGMQSDRADIDRQILLRKLRKGHIDDGKVEIRPISDAQLTRLRELETALDAEIKKDLQLKQTMDFILGVLDAAGELGRILDSAAPTKPGSA